MIELIVARDLNYGIGMGNQLPWKCPRDMQWFKEKTIGKTVVMGKNTFESIGRPLPKRRNIVVTSSNKYDDLPGVEVIRDPASIVGFDDVVIIGGAALYDFYTKISAVDRFYITTIMDKYDCDTFYDFEPSVLEYDLIETHSYDECAMAVYERR